MNKIFTYQTRIYYQQTDAGGFMYHANSLSVIEHARMEFWLACGYKAHQEKEKGFVVANCEISWLKPAFLSDIIEVTVKVTEIKRVSMEFEHEIFRVEESGERTLINTAKVTMIYVNSTTMKACSISEELKNSFLAI